MSQKPISEMNKYELSEIEQQIAARKLQIFADEINASGKLHARIIEGIEYVLVYSPLNLNEYQNVWASSDECRHLMDFLANLPGDEAYRRWYPTVSEKFPTQPYTKQDAIRDTVEARRQLAADYESGKIDGRDYADAYRSTSFMDLITKGK